MAGRSPSSAGFASQRLTCEIVFFSLRPQTLEAVAGAISGITAEPLELTQEAQDSALSALQSVAAAGAAVSAAAAAAATESLSSVTLAAAAAASPAGRRRLLQFVRPAEPEAAPPAGTLGRGDGVQMRGSRGAAAASPIDHGRRALRALARAPPPPAAPSAGRASRPPPAAPPAVRPPPLGSEAPSRLPPSDLKPVQTKAPDPPATQPTSRGAAAQQQLAPTLPPAAASSRLLLQAAPPPRAPDLPPPPPAPAPPAPPDAPVPAVGAVRQVVAVIDALSSSIQSGFSVPGEAPAVLTSAAIHLQTALDDTSPRSRLFSSRLAGGGSAFDPLPAGIFGGAGGTAGNGSGVQTQFLALAFKCAGLGTAVTARSPPCRASSVWCLPQLLHDVSTAPIFCYNMECAGDSRGF